MYAANELRQTLQKLFADVSTFGENPKAVIVPHAGVMYSGHVAAHSFKELGQRAPKINTVVVLGPLHRGLGTELMGPDNEVCEYSSPLGNLRVDKEALSQLRATGLLREVPSIFENDEHSIEMQIPFLIFSLPDVRGVPKCSSSNIWQAILTYGARHRDAALVPLYVGELTEGSLSRVADALLPLFQRQDVVFVVSSDFSHWGSNYDYFYLPPGTEGLPLHEQIRMLDQEAINCLLKADVQCLERHKEKTGNEICGIDALRLLLTILRKDAQQKGRSVDEVYVAKLLKYSQAFKITQRTESSVGYVSMAFFEAENKQKQ